MTMTHFLVAAIAFSTGYIICIFVAVSSIRKLEKEIERQRKMIERLQEFPKKDNSTNKVMCTECGKVVTSVEEMIEHYKEHPELKVIDGVNESKAMEHLNPKLSIEK